MGPDPRSFILFLSFPRKLVYREAMVTEEEVRIISVRTN